MAKKARKESIITIRISPANKELAEQLSSLSGMNISQFFRTLLIDYKMSNTFENRLNTTLGKIETLLKDKI